MKLELKHITPYLPYELKVDYNGKVGYTDSVTLYNDIILIDKNKVTPASICDVKPILRPLSSMTKEEAYELGTILISEADMEDKEVGIGEMALMEVTYPTIVYKDKEDEEYSVTIQFSSTGISGMDLIPYEAYEWLFKHHFDVFGLIGKGLAIAK